MGRTLIVSSQKFRAQSQNKKDVIETMIKFVNHALKEDKPRVATEPTASGVHKRLAGKKAHSEIKKLRTKVSD